MMPSTYHGDPLIYRDRLHPDARPDSLPGKMRMLLCPGCATFTSTPAVFLGECAETCQRCQALIWPRGAQYALLPKQTSTLWLRFPAPPPSLRALLPKVEEAARLQTPFPLSGWEDLVGALGEEDPCDDWIHVLTWEALRSRQWLTPPKIVQVPVAGVYLSRPVVPLAPQRILAHGFLTLDSVESQVPSMGPR